MCKRPQDEVRDAAAGVAPDLRSGGFVVSARIVGIGELVENLALATGLHGVGQIPRFLHTACLRDEHDVRAERLHDGTSLHAHVLGHDEHHVVAPGRRHHGERDARIAAGGLDEGIPGLDLAALLGAADHAEGGPILDRARRIIAFEFGQNGVL